jgi:hypothetical protein
MENVIKNFLQVGSGDGDGYGYGLINIQGNNLYMIDEIPTIIYKIKNNIAFGAIINKDLTFKKCYIAKVGDCFAHGESIKKALNDAQVKFNNNLSEDEKISLFFKEFDIFKKYKALKFYDWHNILTGSCSFGRKSFMENNNIKETDMLNVAQFVELTENQYNGQIIKKIKINLNKLNKWKQEKSQQKLRILRKSLT